MIIDIKKLNKQGYSTNQICNDFDTRKQELILLPTEKCNFRCSYCYEDFRVGKMKPWLVDSIKTFISNRVKSIDYLSLGWFGGEPLIAKKICLDIIKHSFKECEKNNVFLKGSFTTNGYFLTNSLVEELSKYNHASFQVTLDGYGEDHDVTRVSVNGKGTFDTVWSNILSLKNSEINFIITLRLHITCNNYDSMKKMVLVIKEVIGNDKRFNIHFHNISNLGGPNKNNIKVLNKTSYADIISEFSKLLNVKSNSELSLHKNRNICYAAKPNSLLVRANGQIGKCTVILNDSSNNIGKFLPKGEIDINSESLQPWMYGYNSANPNILSCPVKGVKAYNEKHKKALKVNVV